MLSYSGYIYVFRLCLQVEQFNVVMMIFYCGRLTSVVLRLKPKQVGLCLMGDLRLGYPSSECPLFPGLSLQVRVSLWAIVMICLGRGLNRDKCQDKMISRI